jgi:protein-disulfide isomerase
MKKEIRVLFIIATLLFSLFGIGALIYTSKLPLEKPLSQRDQSLVRPDSQMKGPADAPVTIVEFLDFECESCGAFYPSVKEVVKNYEGKILFVVRYMPFHGNSVLAAMAAEAAGRQGKFWEMEHLLFTRQMEWSHQNQPQARYMLGLANELGLDQAKFQIDLTDEANRRKIDRDKADGQSLGVRGTPTFFVNGEMMQDLSQSSLKTMIDKVLAK